MNRIFPLLFLIGCPSAQPGPAQPADMTVQLVSTEPAAFRVAITGAALSCEEDQLRIDAEVIGRPSAARGVVVSEGAARVVDLDLGNPAPDVVFVTLTGQEQGCVEGTLAVIAEGGEDVDCWVRGPEADTLLSGSLDATLGDAATDWQACRRF